MPELQSSIPDPGAGAPIAIEALVPMSEDPDFAFGCECADPALHIAQWLQEARSLGAEAA
jgi:hypothetical protein